MEDSYEKVNSSRKRLRKPKSLEFLGWGSRNLIEFLQSLGRDTTNKISENEVSSIIMSYIREKNRETPSKKRRKTVACDEKLRLLFGTKKINIIKVPVLVERHYVENQEDSFLDYLCTPENDKQQSLFPSDKVAKRAKLVVQKPKGTFAAIVSDNVKLLYLRKSLVQELAKTPETFESKVVGTFVRIKNPCQLVHVTGVKEGNPIDGNLLQVTNYSYYLNDVPTSSLSDDDFYQEECEELRQRMKNGFAKRLTVVDMEEKARSLHEDVTKQWLARELVLLQRLINQANEKGWRRELSQYLEKRELLQNPDEQLRLLCEVPEIVAEELESECVDDDRKIENDLIVPNPEASTEAHHSEDEQQRRDSPVSSVKESLKNSKLFKNPEEQMRLLREVPKVVAEEHEPELEDDDVKKENDFIVSKPEACIDAHQSEEEQQRRDSPVSSVKESLENSKLLKYPEEQWRLLHEVSKVVAEELEPELEDDDGKKENDSIVPKPEACIDAHQSGEEQQRRDSPVSSVKESLKDSKLLKYPEEQLRLLHEVPEVVAEELKPELEDDDGKKENDFIAPKPEACIDVYQSEEEKQLSDSPVSSVQKTLENSNLRDEEDQPTWTASAGVKDLHEDLFELPANGITQSKDSINEGEMNTNVSQQQSSIPVIDLSNQPQAQRNPPEIIELSDDDDDEEDRDNQAYQHYDPKKVMWFYEFPKGKTHGPFSLTDLKEWNEEYFVGIPEFKVWRTGESAVLLTKLLLHIKT